MKQAVEHPAAPQAKVGRPRADRDDSGLGTDPREEILAAASRLFTTDGYGRTSTKQIADAVGLRQASIYYYFPRKETILAELLDRTVASSLRYAEALEEVEADPQVKLWLLIVNDLSTLFSPPGNLSWLMFEPEARSESMGPFWEKRNRLLSAYEQLVEAGITSGEFRPDTDAVRTARIIFSMVEGTATAIVAGAPIEPDKALCRSVAEHALRSLVTDADAMNRIVAEADRTSRSVAPRRGVASTIRTS
jgi:AcrR family transcriptional regulator